MSLVEVIQIGTILWKMIGIRLKHLTGLLRKYRKKTIS